MNAMTYVNIGLALADMMSTMVPGRDPYRLRANGEGSGVSLRWLNGTSLPKSVRILRDGTAIGAALPGTTTSFLDSAVQPGTHKYELVFDMPETPCAPMVTTFEGGVTQLTLTAEQGKPVLAWHNNMAYKSIRVMRNGSVLAEIPGSATAFTDDAPLKKGQVTYSVVPVNGKAVPATVQRDMDLRCKLGILDVTANKGFNPATRQPWKMGDHYRLAFVSSAPTKAESSDLATYDAFLQKLAEEAGIGGTWKILGASSTVDARDYTATNPDKNGPGDAIFLLDGRTIVANNSRNLWSGAIRARINRTERGNTYTGPVYTGFNADGTKRPSHFGCASVEYGTTGQDGRYWAIIFGDKAANAHPIYALSDPLPIVSTEGK